MNTHAKNLTPEPARNAGPDCAPVSGSRCCSAPIVLFRADFTGWSRADGQYSDDERATLDDLNPAWPDREPPSIYCSACSSCGKLSEGWMEPDALFGRANPELSRAPRRL